MSTNGLTHTVEHIEGSDVEAPLLIQKLTFCKSKKTLIVVYNKRNDFN